MLDQPGAVRPAEPADTQEVIRLAGLMYEAMGIDASDAAWQRAAADQLHRRLGGDVMVFVVDDPGSAGRLAATGAASITTRLPGPGNPAATVAYIQWISTDPAWRRRGLARLITKALLDWLTAREVRLIELHATADGERLYRALGFAPGAHLAMRWRGETVLADAVQL